MPDPTIPAIYIVINGPLGMSTGKIAAQTFQVFERLSSEIVAVGNEQACERFYRDWREHTTTIVRVAKTPMMWERVKAEVGGVVMVDEGYTEVDPGTETCFASWPLLLAEVPKILSNAKVPLL